MKKIKFWYHAAVSYVCYCIWWGLTDGGKNEKETKIRYFFVMEWYKHAVAIGLVEDILDK